VDLGRRRRCERALVPVTAGRHRLPDLLRLGRDGVDESGRRRGRAAALRVGRRSRGRKLHLGRRRVDRRLAVCSRRRRVRLRSRRRSCSRT
jgi:hypothetical protein